MKQAVRFAAIHRYRKKYPIAVACRFLGVSRSGYYSYVGRLDKPDRDASLAQQIAVCQDRCGRTYGYRRVQIWLARQGIRRNPKTVLRSFAVLVNLYEGRSWRAGKYALRNGELVFSVRHINFSGFADDDVSEFVMTL